ncbi:hypothetical protein C5167_003588 [Papaver somniferum]|uniref:Uncharacterized protein n=1 Tax=Papaver somniferum TaxID=3469 RepID=A0A4Y7KYH7_PAPSO|nr:hypothetical protein C5167_003588 [Papaver somniferum]
MSSWFVQGWLSICDEGVRDIFIPLLMKYEGLFGPDLVYFISGDPCNMRFELSFPDTGACRL